MIGLLCLLAAVMVVSVYAGMNYKERQLTETGGAGSSGKEAQDEDGPYYAEPEHPPAAPYQTYQTAERAPPNTFFYSSNTDESNLEFSQAVGSLNSLNTLNSCSSLASSSASVLSSEGAVNPVAYDAADDDFGEGASSNTSSSDAAASAIYAEPDDEMVASAAARGAVAVAAAAEKRVHSPGRLQMYLPSTAPRRTSSAGVAAATALHLPADYRESCYYATAGTPAADADATIFDVIGSSDDAADDIYGTVPNLATAMTQKLGGMSHTYRRPATSVQPAPEDVRRRASVSSGVYENSADVEVDDSDDENENGFVLAGQNSVRVGSVKRTNPLYRESVYATEDVVGLAGVEQGSVL